MGATYSLYDFGFAGSQAPNHDLVICDAIGVNPPLVTGHFVLTSGAQRQLHLCGTRVIVAEHLVIASF